MNGKWSRYSAAATPLYHLHLFLQTLLPTFFSISVKWIIKIFKYTTLQTRSNVWIQTYWHMTRQLFAGLVFENGGYLKIETTSCGWAGLLT